jgi:hypothetical protein
VIVETLPNIIVLYLLTIIYFFTLNLAIMKVFHLIFLLTVVSFVSCAKKEETTLPKSDISSVGKPISELIIGNWQLTSIGTVSQVSSSSNSGYSSTSNSGCGSGESHNETNWSATSLKENLVFKPSGDFLKNGSNDAVCTGTYKVSDGAIFMKTGCSADEQKQIINAINPTTLIVAEDNQTLLRYERK